jgi:hypothetical protein
MKNLLKQLRSKLLRRGQLRQPQKQQSLQRSLKRPLNPEEEGFSPPFLDSTEL